MTWRGGLAIAAVVLVAACSATPGPHASTYTFNSSDSAVKVDTPQLRAMKAAADIAPCPEAETDKASSAANMPNITLPCLGGGRSVDLASLRGPLLLNFWSQTCAPCRTESPLLQELSTAARGTMRVVGVDFYDPRPSLALGFAKLLGLTYPQVADPDGATRGSLHIAALPTTLLIDAAGHLVYTQVGPVTSAAQLAALVKDHLGVTVTLHDLPRS